ncbi:MAG: CocE/NonD family hydrolase [Acidimicrobiia bacterium]|nr:CocE/NonD family hydrolase [Acidimicrobiia bacterium]
MTRGRPLVLVVVAGLLAAACSDDSSSGGAQDAATTTATATTAGSPSTTVDAAPATAAAPTTAVAPTTAAADTTSGGEAEPELAAWTVQPGWEQLAVLDADPGTTLELVAVGDETDVVATGDVDDLGSLLFRDLAPGPYRVRSEEKTSETFEVVALDEVPDPSFYAGQALPAGGFGYLVTRDGTTLSINVVLPGPADGGPYPTVVEYSGYQPSDPGSGGFAQLFPALGYAYVGVNMRGSGCSGGSFEFFEPAQSLDGYDVIEAVAAQPWVQDHRVGMVGVSYPGISQLFVAATQPPSLAAITPLSVIEDSALSVLYPGGILNTGFGVEWTQARVEETQPEGQEWTTERIAGGDQACAENQRLRLQNPDLVALIRENPFWTDELAAPIAPRLFVDQITVPTFLAGAWQDEQTGGRFATMLDRFTGTEHFYATLLNGLHIESIGAGVFPRYVEFLDLYVGRRVPALDAARAVSPILAGGIFGTDQVTLPPDRFTGQTYEQALATFESEPPIQVLFEGGAADGALPGSPQPRFAQSFESWPVPAEARPFYLGPDGSLGPDVPAAGGGATSYTADPAALPDTFHDESTGSVWAYDVQWQWQQPPEGTAASFVSVPFTEETVIIGSGSADLWIRSSAEDTDLEVTISEIRPDGKEVYLQSGWLRTSKRALDEAASTEVRPVQTFREEDAAPLPAGEWTPVRVEIYPVAHAFRPGSQLRVTVDAPGNSRAAWIFATIADGETVEIAHDGAHPSRIVLPVVSGIDVPDGLPTCTLRGQPCRDAPG